MNYGEANVLASTSLRALHVNRNLSITDNKEAKRDLSPLLQKLLQLFMLFSSLHMKTTITMIIKKQGKMTEYKI